MSHPSTLDLDRHSSLDKSRRSTGRSQSRAEAKYGDVLCDFCTTRKQKAEKSCLVCLASYCESHLQSHYEYPAMMKHKLVKATGQMREKICAQHDKLLEAFCRTDQTSVCVLCMMDEHKHHDIVPAGTERTEKQVSGENISQSILLGKILKGQFEIVFLVQGRHEDSKYFICSVIIHLQCQPSCHPLYRNNLVPRCTNLSRGLTRELKNGRISDKLLNQLK